MSDEVKKGPWVPPIEGPLRGVKKPHPDNPVYCSCLHPPAKPDEHCRVHGRRGVETELLDDDGVWVDTGVPAPKR